MNKCDFSPRLLEGMADKECALRRVATFTLSRIICFKPHESILIRMFKRKINVDVMGCAFQIFNEIFLKLHFFPFMPIILTKTHANISFKFFFFVRTYYFFFFIILKEKKMWAIWHRRFFLIESQNKDFYQLKNIIILNYEIFLYQRIYIPVNIPDFAELYDLVKKKKKKKKTVLYKIR